MSESQAGKRQAEFFPDLPSSDFMVYNRSISLESPDNYSLYLPDMEGLNLLVLKYGTSVVSHKKDYRTRHVIRCIAEEVSHAMDDFGKKVIIITSGAVHQGSKEIGRLGLSGADSAMSAFDKRRSAGIGQRILMSLYGECFNEYGKAIAQILLTHKDWDDEKTRENVTDLLNSYLNDGVVPLLNEDDVRSLEEIEDEHRWFRDNDGLWSLTVRQLNQDPQYNGMVFAAVFTDQRGIRPGSYFESERPLKMEEKVIRIVRDSHGLEEQIPQDIEGNGKGRGGMESKILACREVSRDGIHCLVANGSYDRLDRKSHPYRPLKAILENKCIGTRFLPAHA